MGVAGTHFGLVLVLAPWFSLGTLTALGASHRGQRRLSSLASGILFPLTWAVWYVIDDRAIGRSTGARTPARCWKITRLGRS